MQSPQFRNVTPGTAYQRYVHGVWEPHRSRIIASLEDQAGPPCIEDDEGDRRWARLANKLKGCCQSTQFIQRSDGAAVVAESRCKSRLCPRCNYFRSRKVLGKVLAILAQCDQPKLLTLTVRSCDEPLRDQITRLTRCFKELRRTRLWRDHVAGGAYALEVTFNAETAQWHPHLHAVIDAQYVAQSALADTWERITTDSRIVDIRAVYSRTQAASYVAGYVAKSSDLGHLPDDRIPEWAESIHGLRMLQTFGNCHGIKAEEPDHDERDKQRLIAWADEVAGGSERGHALCREVMEALLTTDRRLPVRPAPSATSPSYNRAVAVATKLWNWRAHHHGHTQPTQPPRRSRTRPPTRDDPHLFGASSDDTYAPKTKAEMATHDPLTRPRP